LKRWNGWGDIQIPVEPISPRVRQYLFDRLGQLKPTETPELDRVLSKVPRSRLPPHELIDSDPEIRLRHARGQSLPDWIALRSGRIGAVPDGVSTPETEKEIQHLFNVAADLGAVVIPYGGGTSVLGHINPQKSDQPVLTISMRRFDRLISLDSVSHLAVMGAGMRGPEIEHELNTAGFTLGHYPQSFELSTLGGWIATRSTGSQSHYYGRIEDLFAGGRLITPTGPLDLPEFPASAAGPDLRHIVLGSEGRLGVITWASMRVSPLPNRERFYGAFFSDFEAGFEAMRDLAQERVPVSMARLSDAEETESTLTMLDRPRLSGLLSNGLRLMGLGAAPCLLILGLTGSARITRAADRQARRIIRRSGGIVIRPVIGPTWHASRYKTPYLRNSLWEAGVALDTLETALPYAKCLQALADIKNALHDAAAEHNERILAFAHCSHQYRDGSNLYVTFLFRHFRDPERTMALWRSMKRSASQTILEHGGTISHQHGVGLDHRDYLSAEKGALGMQALANIRSGFDPGRMLNPGKLIDDQEFD
jgi:alkyldihydroxyacetonephosphate synthase